MHLATFTLALARSKDTTHVLACQMVRKIRFFTLWSASTESKPFKFSCLFWSLQKGCLLHEVCLVPLPCTCCKYLELHVSFCCVLKHNTSHRYHKHGVFHRYVLVNGLASYLVCWTFYRTLGIEELSSCYQFFHSIACVWYVRFFSLQHKNAHLRKLVNDLLRKLFHWQS